MGRRLLVLVFLAGCGGHDVGPNSAIVGGPCSAAQPCAAGSRCLIDGDFPGGMCALPCAVDANCPGGSVCVSEKDGVCLPSCATPADCRPGYNCKGKSRKGQPGEVLVCID